MELHAKNVKIDFTRLMTVTIRSANFAGINLLKNVWNAMNVMVAHHVKRVTVILSPCAGRKFGELTLQIY